VLSRIGLGLVFPALSAASLRVLPAALVALGCGEFTRQLGGAFRVNLLAVALERRIMLHGGALAATQTRDNATTMTILQQVAAIAHTAPLPHDQQVAAAVWFLSQTIYAQANVLAYRDGFLITAIVFAAALLPTWLLDRARRQQWIPPPFSSVLPTHRACGARHCCDRGFGP
jgi:DHA2 family multidrug resistance protein